MSNKLANKDSLRAKINLAILATFSVIVLVFSAIIIPFGQDTELQGIKNAKLFLETLALREKNHFVNDLFEKRERAIKIRIDDLVKIEPIVAVSVTDDQKHIFESARTPEYKGLSQKLSLNNSGNNLGSWMRSEPKGGPVLVHSIPLVAAGEKIGRLNIYYSLVEVKRQVVRMYSLFACLVLALLGIMLFQLNMLLHFSVLKPLLSLRDGIRKSWDAGPGAEVKATSEDEIGALTREFNRLSRTQKQMLEEIRSKEQRLSQALTAATDSVMEWNHQTGEVYYSHQWYELLGYPEGELDMNLKAFKELCHPEDYPTVIKAVDRVISEPNTSGYEIEFRMRCKDGRYKWLLGRGNVIRSEADGQPFLISGTNSDITLRKQAEEESKQSLENFKSLFDLLPFTCLIHDSNLRILLANRYYRDAVGLSEEAIIGKTIKELDRDVDDGTVNSLMEEFNRTGKIDAREITILTPTAKQNAIVSSCAINWQNEPAIISATVDITIQKQSELRYQTLFNSANDAIFIIKGDRIIQCNSKALDMFGCVSAELLTATPIEFSPERQADGSLSRESAEEKMQTVYAGKNLNFEWLHCRLDGTVFDAEVSLSLAEFGGEKFLQAIVRDVTERKNAEKQLNRMASIIERATELIVITNRKGNIEYANPAFEKATQYSLREVLGETIQIIRSDTHDYEFYENLQETILSDQVWQGRMTNKNKEGQLFIQDLTISPVFNSSKENAGFVWVGRDVTRQIRLEEDLRQAQKMEAIGTLAGGIAHDFNNILTAIFGYAELAEMHIGKPEKVQDDLREILGSAKRAQGLVRQILTYSRKSEQAMKPVQMSLVVKEVAKLMRASLPSSIEIRRNISVADQTVLADPTQIHQILMNLCTNAYHAMLKQGGTLGVSLREIEIKEEDLRMVENLHIGPYLELEVSDTGCGMDKQTQEKIFEPYFTTKATGEGTGLGLAVVQGIVKSHNGAIHVYSEPGQGSIFRVYFPMVKDAFATGQQADKKNEDLRGHGHIIYVDDEERLINMATEIFTAYGYKVSTFSDPIKAWDAFQKEPNEYDLLVTDMTMPGMNGLELAQKAMALRKGLPVILSSGYSEIIDRQTAQDLGIREFVSKPMVMSSLVTIIKNILNQEKA